MIVVKFGGHAMTDSHGDFARAIASAREEGAELAIVHGGGPQINAALDDAGIAPNFLGGFRVTTPETFAIVERVLAGEVGPHLAESLAEHGVPAISLSGRKSKILYAEKLTSLVDGSSADLGQVGSIVEVDPEPIYAAISIDRVPVVSPIAAEKSSEVGFNVNADIAAAAIAGAVSADALIIMTDVPGIYRKWPDTSSLIESISMDELNQIKGTFAEGMAPKVQACLDAIDAGAKAVRIIDGTNPDSLKDALLNRGGTLVTA